jgi:hypothetical protein
MWRVKSSGAKNQVEGWAILKIVNLKITPYWFFSV